MKTPSNSSTKECAVYNSEALVIAVGARDAEVRAELPEPIVGQQAASPGAWVILSPNARHEVTSDGDRSRLSDLVAAGADRFLLLAVDAPVSPCLPANDGGQCRPSETDRRRRGRRSRARGAGCRAQGHPLMPVPRHLAIVVCNCGKRWGRVDRAQACEEMEATEHAILASSVPLMVRHWQLGHRFTLGENAPREFLDTIARAAARAAGDGGEGDAGEPGRLRLTAVED